MEINRFNVRVYFVLFDSDKRRVLVSDEIIRGKHYTKFPGGGLEFGEGTLECARREAQEELGQEIEITGHLYTTDFFLQSIFKPGDQVISIYYTAQLIENATFRTSELRHDFQQQAEDEESFRWVILDQLNPNDFDLAADKKVVELLIGRKSG